MAEQEEISESRAEDSLIESTVDISVAAEDVSKLIDPETENETAEVIAVEEREFLDIFGHKKPAKTPLFGGKPAELFLWRNRKLSASVLGGATIIWILFELLDFHLTTVICHILIFCIGLSFLWSNATIFINKRTPNVPDIHIQEEPFLELASILHVEINRFLVIFRGIAFGGDLKKFLTVIGVLWVFSVVGSFFDFLALAYTLLVLLFTVPVVYEKYDDKIDAFVEKAICEMKKQYGVIDAKFLSKIPRLPLDKKKD